MIHGNSSTELKYKVKDKMDELCEQRQAFKRVRVPKSLRNPHPLVTQSLKLLETRKSDENGILKSPPNKCLDVRVSLKSLHRALRIMDAVLTAFDEQKYHVSIDKDGTWVRALGDELRFGIHEELDSEKINNKYQDLSGYYHFGHSQFEFIRKPSGRLCLTIHQIKGYWATNARKNWRDTNTKKLEDRVDGFLEGVLRLVLDKKAHDKEEEERRLHQLELKRQHEERQRQQEELRQKIQVEKQRVSQLIMDAENRFKSEQIRRFIDAVQHQYSAGNRIYEPASDLDNWISWANRQADRLDPLAPDQPSILDEESKLDSEKEGVRTYSYNPWDFDE